MVIQNEFVKELLEKYQPIAQFGRLRALTEWDMQVMMPKKGTAARAQQSAFLADLITRQWLEDGFNELISKAEDATLNEQEKAIIRNLKREAHYFYRIPKELHIEKAKLETESFMAWQQAKKDNTFETFLPFLEKVYDMHRAIAGYLGYDENPYDALLDLYEPHAKEREVQAYFATIRQPLVDLLHQITSSSRYNEDPGVTGDRKRFSSKLQEQLSRFILGLMHYDFEAGRLDSSAHPFTITIDRNDVRITSWYNEHDIRESMMAAIHEGGHALYEQGIDEAYTDTPIAGGVSLAIHESQSRFWENQIGRNPAFIRYISPILHALFPDMLHGVSDESLVLYFNQVHPSLVRVEADEVTYNLHIAIRFELEDDLINQRIKVQDLPELWRVKMKEYLGVEPQTDREGVLQDMHWATGAIGYFPTYTLGNLYAGQLLFAMKKEIDVDAVVTQGNFETILSWLRTKIHSHGSVFWPHDLLMQATGEALNPQYFLSYISEKYSAIYRS